MEHFGTGSKKENRPGIAVQTIGVTAIVSEKEKWSLGWRVGIGMGERWKMGMSLKCIPWVRIKLCLCN